MKKTPDFIRLFFQVPLLLITGFLLLAGTALLLGIDYWFMDKEEEEYLVFKE